MTSFLRIVALLAIFAFFIFLQYNRTNSNLAQSTRDQSCSTIEPVVTEVNAPKESSSQEPMNRQTEIPSESDENPMTSELYDVGEPWSPELENQEDLD